MRILTLRRMLGITAIGVAYVHGKRGGDATFASISETLRYLWSSVAGRLGLAKQDLHAGPGPTVTSRVPIRNGLASERPPRPPGS